VAGACWIKATEANKTTGNNTRNSCGASAGILPPGSNFATPARGQIRSLILMAARQPALITALSRS
jgi:hypothetical protein